MPIKENLSGSRFGNLTVLEFSHFDKHKSSHWRCLCDCGFVKTCNRMHLVRGEVTSCGRGNQCPVERVVNFLAKVAYAPSGCWEWTASREEFGYGQFSLKKGRSINAHYASYTMFIGPVPKGLFVLHSCDNPPCVCPAHLFLGTQGDNMADKVKKHRQAQNERHGMVKLSNDQVLEIRDRAAKGEVKAHLAKEFSVSATHISRIVQQATRKFTS